MTKKRILKEIKLNEISMVDRPAQEGAVATIIKRRDDDLEKMVIAFTSSESDHQHGLVVRGYDDYMIGVSYAGSDEKKHDHEVIYKDGIFVVSENEGHTHAITPEDTLKILAEINRLKLKNSEQSDMVKEATTQAPCDAVKTANLEETQMTEKAETMTAKADGPSMSAVMGLLRRIANMSDDQVKSLKMMDDEKVKKCVSGELDLGAELDAIAKANPIVEEYGGITVRKNDSDDKMQMLKMKKELDATNAKLADENLEKRAKAELNHLGGELSGKTALLKAVDALEGEAKDAAVAVLKAADEAASKDFVEKGEVGDIEKAKSESASDKLDNLAKAHAKEHNVGFYDAYDIVSKSNPDLYASAVKGE